MTISEEAQRPGILTVTLGGEARHVPILGPRATYDWQARVLALCAFQIGTRFRVQLLEIIAVEGDLRAESERVVNFIDALTIKLDPNDEEELMYAYLQMATPSADLELLRKTASPEEISTALAVFFQASFPDALKVQDRRRLH